MQKCFEVSVWTLSTYRCFMMPLQQTTFKYIVTKEEIAQKGEISPFATMFSTQLNNYNFIYRKFPYFCLDVFKVVCCRFSVNGKGFNHLTLSNLQTSFEIIVAIRTWCPIQHVDPAQKILSPTWCSSMQLQHRLTKSWPGSSYFKA